MRYGLTEKQLAGIKAVLAQFPAIDTAILFGSRAMGTHKAASDVDITIKGKDLDTFLAAKIKTYFEEETYLPYFFDVLAYDDIQSEELREHIDRVGKIIYLKGWVETVLGEKTIKIGSGSTPRGGNESYKSTGISLIRSQNILNFDFSYNGLAFIDNSQAAKLKNVEVLEGDVLINITGDSVARVCKVPKEVLPARVNQHVSILRVDGKKLNSNYLQYYLLNPIYKRHLLALANSGGTRNALTKNMLEILALTIPPLPEQKAIASVLSAFDDKIELLREQNKTLETLAQTIFKEWFVHFNFPDKDGKPYRDNGGEMLDSELGEIPKGWRVGKLGGVTNIKGGGTPSTKDSNFGGGTIYWTSPKDLSNSKSIFLLNTEKKITQAGLENISSGLLPKGTLLLSSRAPIGYLAISNIDISINQGYIALLNDGFLANKYMFFWLKIYMCLVTNSANGSTFLEISKTAFRNIECVIPEKEVLKKFDNFAKPIFQKIKNNAVQIQTLSKTRDTLLPKLMSGEKRVNGINELQKQNDDNG